MHMLIELYKIFTFVFNFGLGCICTVQFLISIYMSQSSNWFLFCRFLLIRNTSLFFDENAVRIQKEARILDEENNHALKGT